MPDEFTAEVPQFALTHVDGVALPTVNPAYGTPLIRGGRLAFLPRGPHRWLPDSDGSVLLSVDAHVAYDLAGDYLEVAPGHFTFPVPMNPRRPPPWKATINGDRVRVERRFPEQSNECQSGEPWYWTRIRTLDFVRVPALLRWPHDEVVASWRQGAGGDDAGAA